ncbi:MAG TPA: hypothetical protein VGM80_16115 [Gaiellaceae bacterium]
MRWLLIATVVSVTGLAAATASASKPPDPCVLLSTTDASTALGSTPSKPKTTTVGTARSCTYAVKKKTMIVATTRVATQAAFDKAAKAKGLAFQIQGVGADAWTVARGKTLLVWKNGVQISITFAGVNVFVATQQSLAKTAIGRL